MSEEKEEGKSRREKSEEQEEGGRREREVKRDGEYGGKGNDVDQSHYHAQLSQEPSISKLN